MPKRPVVPKEKSSRRGNSASGKRQAGEEGAARARRRRSPGPFAVCSVSEQQEHYRSLIELSPDAVMVHSDGIVVFLNPAGFKLFGAALPTDLLGKKVLDFVRPDYRNAVLERMRLSYEQRAGLPSLEIKAQRIDGTTVDVEVSTVPVTYGGKIATMTLLRDITKRKELEDALRNAATFPAENPNPVLEFDGSGSVTYYNVAAMNVLRELHCGKDFTLFLPKDAEELLAAARDAERTVRTFQREIVIRDRIFMASLHVAPRNGRLRVYAYDVTERKRYEEELRIKDKAIETSMSGIAFSDMSGRLTYVNGTFLSMWGYGEPSEVLGREVQAFWDLPEQARYVVNELGQRDQWQGELLAKRRDGSTFPAEVLASFVRDERGDPLCMMGSFSDITDRKRMTEMLERSRDDLASRVRERTDALRDAHHEIANLLEEIGDAFFALDREWRFRYINGQAIRFFGRDASSFLGRSIWDAVPEIAGTVYQSEFERASRDRTPVVFDAQFPGHARWVEARAYGAPDGISVFLHEVSEQKEMERHLLLTADLLKLFAQTRSRDEYLGAAVNVLKGWCGCSNIGIRLTDGRGNLPFASCSGYTPRFLSKEQLLSLHDDNCVCTRIVLGTPDPHDRSAMTASGSFICNDLALFQQNLDVDARSRYRGACVTACFRTIAVVPVRYREQTFGAIHIADERPGIVSHRMKESLEQASMIVGEALFRFAIEDDLRRNYGALKESEERYRSVVQDVPDIIFTTDREGRITSLNPAFERVLGWPVDTWIGRTFTDSLHPEDIDAARHLFGDALQGMGPATHLFRARTAEGAYRTLEVRLSPGGRKDRDLLGICRDITERIRKEEERIRLESAVESAVDAVMIIEPERGVITYVNRAFELLSGYSKQDVLGMSHLDIAGGIHEPGPFRDAVAAIEREGVWRGNVRARRKDGTSYVEDCSLSPVRDASGRTINYIFITRDVTEKLRLESIAEAVSMMDNIGSVFAGVRHEIGNPVNSLHMILRILASKLDDLPKEKIREYIANMSEQVQRMEGMLHSLKNFNLFETQEPTSVAVAKFAENFLPLVRTDCERRGVVLDEFIAPDAGRMYVDARALQHVLLNLVTNAVDAMSDRPGPRITIHVTRERSSIRFEIRDNGRGIPQAQLTDIFRPFYTTKKNGTGLGLVIVRKMLTNMGGTIDIRSGLGQGTTAIVRVPVSGKGMVS